MKRQNPIFLDNNATTRPLASVQEAVFFAMNEGFGNPSSSHRGGESARRIIAISREQIARLITGRPDQIVFTSGATEANNWVFRSVLGATNDAKLVSTETEHSSVKEIFENLHGYKADCTFLKVGHDGLVELDDVLMACQNSPTLLSIHWVNNETGVVQPVGAIAEICQEFGVLFHVDGSQAVGKLPIDLSLIGIDFLTCTAHKLHGPQGIGALYCREPNHLQQLFFGGGQESGLRPGTENLPGIAGFGKAAEVRQQSFDSVTLKLTHLRDDLEQRVLQAIPETYINGSVLKRVCNTTNLRFSGVDGQALVAQLDAAGIQCSQSSACTSQIPESSYVLRAMGLTEDNAYSSIRFSFSELNTSEEMDFVVDVLTKRVKALRNFSKSLSSN